MTRPPADEIDAHNHFQRRYFDGPIQRTITPSDSRHVRRQMDETLRVAAITPGERVLEIGCGMGRCTLLLAERGVQIEGLDLSPMLLDRLRACSAGRFDIPVHCADVLDPPAALHGAFDVLLGVFVLHHLKDLDGSFVAMRHLLKPGGRMIFLEANAYNPLFYVQMLFTAGMTWQGDKGIADMRAGRIFRAMRGAGLDRLTMTRFGMFPAFIADREWGARLGAALERVPVWRPLLPFQLFRGERKA